ncbi:MAG: DUF192 domain-containing protein [bacterium]
MTSNYFLLLSSFVSVFLLLKLLLKPSPRRLAGPVIITVITIAAFFVLIDNDSLRLGLILSAALTLLIGVLDDRRNLHPATQLLGQGLIVAAVVLSGWSFSYVTNPAGAGLIYLNQLQGALLAGLWLIFLINAVNWLDGSDGLASSVGVVAFITLIIVSLLPATRDTPTLNLALIGLGALAAFLIWNWPPAKVYLGTSGSWWLGLYLGMVAIIGRGKIVTTVLVLALPLLDAVYVIIKRLLKGQPPWRGDTVSHFHHRLRARGVSPRAICLIAAALSAILGTGALLLTLDAGDTNTCPDFNEATVNIAGQQFSVGLAATPDRHSRGLSGCRRLPPNSGLYFSFNTKQVRSFWMKDMLIPIDIIWIADSAVIGIEHSAPPPGPDQTDLPHYTPPQPVDAVLELAAGATSKLNIKTGSRTSLTK